MFENAEIIHAYTRQDAIDDGLLVDAREGEYSEIAEQHFGQETPVTLTQSLNATIEEAVAHEKFCNDAKGVLHDIFWMAKCGGALSDLRAGSQKTFEVIITGLKGAKGRVVSQRQTQPTMLTVGFDGQALTFGYSADF